MRVAAIEQGVLTQLKALHDESWRAHISVKYRHGLDILIGGIEHPVFVSTATKGLFPSHMVVSSSVLEVLLEKPLETTLNLTYGRLQARQPASTLVLVNRPFDLHLNLRLPQALDSVWFNGRVAQYRRLLSFIASSGGLEPFECLFSSSWVHRGAFDVDSQVATAMQSLLGCGAGSTPAGDDMLVGAASVCTAFSSVSGKVGERARTWLDALTQNQSLFEKRTTLMSCGYLNAALDGVFGSHLIGLHKAFFGVSRVSLLQAMVRVKKHGSTSGVDALAGVYLGFRMVLDTCERD